MKTIGRLEIRHAAFIALVGIAGCEPGSAGTTVDGPQIVLDADNPVAAFEITLCMEGPALRSVVASARVRGEWTAPEGDAVVVMPANLDADLHSDDIDFDNRAADEGEFRVAIETEGGPWGEQSGRRCQPAQTVEFELVDPADAGSASVTWSVRFGANFNDRLVRGNELRDEHFFVEIEPR